MTLIFLLHSQNVTVVIFITVTYINNCCSFRNFIYTQILFNWFSKRLDIFSDHYVFVIVVLRTYSGNIEVYLITPKIPKIRPSLIFARRPFQVSLIGEGGGGGL